MRLALFSQIYTGDHEAKLVDLLGKELSEVSFLFITSAVNYKPYKADWFVKSENRLRSMFPNFREIDLQRVIEIDAAFNFEEYFSKFDMIHMGGGNTFMLMYWLKKTGVDEIIKKMVREDRIVLGGESAGAVVLTHNITPYSYADNPLVAPQQYNEGLGLIDFAPLPHWGLEGFEEILGKTLAEFDTLNIPVKKIENDKALFIKGDEFTII